MYMNCFCIRIAKELNKSEPGSSRNPNDQDYKRNSTANTLHILPQHWERVRWRICFVAVSSPTFGTVMVSVSLLDFFCTLAGSLRRHLGFPSPKVTSARSINAPMAHVCWTYWEPITWDLRNCFHWKHPTLKKQIAALTINIEIGGAGGADHKLYNQKIKPAYRKGIGNNR